MTNGLRVNLQHLIHIPRKSRSRRRAADTLMRSLPFGKVRPMARDAIKRIAWPIALTAASTDAEFLRGHLGAFDAVCDLLERDIAGNVGRTVARLDVDAERREAAIVGRA